MTFSDDDLRRLKDDCDLNGVAERFVELIPNDVIALLARLDAAEKVCYVLLNTKSISEASAWNRLSAWLKSKGAEG